MDGPGPDVQRLGGVDLARDATGALVYVRRDGGVDHVFAARFAGGQWGAPERVDAALDGPSSQPVVASAEGGRTAIAFVNGGALYGVVRPAGAPGWGAPTALDGSGAVSSPDLDMSVSGVAYAVYASGGDVRAVRLDKGSGWAAVPALLDIDPARAAGDSATKRPRVAVAADNVALAAWGEDGADGRTHVFARRLFGTSLSAVPQEASVDGLGGEAGGPADSADLDIEWDSSFAWVAFRETLGGRSRVLARRMAGSTFDPPVALDGLGAPAGDGGIAPRLDMTGHGEGLAVVSRDASFETIGSSLDLDQWGPPARLDSLGSASPPVAAAAVGENAEGLVAWARSTAPGAPGDVRARTFTPMPATFADEAVIAPPALGAVDASLGLEASADRVGNASVVFLAGGAGDRRLVTALYDRPPVRVLGKSTDHWRRASRPRLLWNPSSEIWGSVGYQVVLDGRALPPTSATSLVVPARLADGVHTWSVTTTDMRGQQAPGKLRRVRIDARRPRVRVRRRGRRVTVSAFDGPRARSSGIAAVSIAFGDGARASARGGSVTHHYRAGRWTLRVGARDRAGNVAAITRRVHIR